MKSLLWKFLILIPVLALLTVSCGPATEIIDVEARIPAEYSVDFNEKSVAVFFSVRETEADESLLYNNDTVLLQNLSTGIATSIEENLYLDKGGVYVFKHYPDDSTKYDTPYIHDLSFNSNSDIIVIVDSVKVGHIGIVDATKYDLTTSYRSNYIYAPYHSVIKIYDAITAEQIVNIQQKDTIYWEILSRNDLRPEVMAIRARQSMPDVSKSIGAEVVKSLFPSWQEQRRSLYVYPAGTWMRAAENAKNFRWREAMDFWIRESKSEDPVKSAAASYNIAIACELTDRHQLALEWTEFSLKRYKLPGVSEYKQLLIDKLEKAAR